ncbi:N-acetyltransferase [Bacillus sp. Marseille-Q1617]|uniref:GNAT family N-acetyltransferase n=1 Tax=Bacillus sp. Marseille-Q1617 TaxID=2736887 RepID=UPI0020CA2BFA|nr:GNAT family N-acetyltransferase [Bacillus sp. Marseille-Q1617]
MIPMIPLIKQFIGVLNKFMNELLFKEMTNTEFKRYFADKIQRYSLVLTQNSFEVNEDVNEKARNQLRNLLPEGIHTNGHYLFNIKHDKQTIGYLWIKEDKEKKSVFLYEIFIFNEYRNKGYGTRAMKKIELWMKQHDLLYLKLHVFGNNREARKLYENIGFEIAGVNMFKKVNGSNEC